MKKYSKRSFKKVFVLTIILFCIGSFSIPVFYLLSRCYHNSFNLKREKISLAAKFVSSKVEDMFENYEKLISNLAYGIYLDRTGSKSSIYRSLKFAIKTNPSIISLKILDSSLKVTTCYPFEREEIGIDYSGYDFVRASLSEGTSWSQVYVSPYKGLPVIAVAACFELGVLVGEMDLQIVQDNLRPKNHMPDLYVIVVDSKGNLVAHPKWEMVTQRMNISHEPIVEKTLRGEESGPEFTLQGKAFIGASSRLNLNGWAVIVGEPKEKALAKLRSSTLSVILLLALLACLGALIAWFWVKQLLVPFKTTLNVTNKVREGKIDDLSQESNYKEFQEIFDSLNSMAQAIKDRENALRASEAKYRDLVEGAVDPIVIVDIEGNIMEVNKAFLDIGYVLNEVIGRHITDFLGPKHKYLFQYARERILNKESIQFEAEGPEHEGGRKWYSVSVRPILNEAGELVAAQWIARDITELKRSEEALRISENRFKELYNSVSDFIYTQDLDGKILSCNPALSRLFGYEPEEFVGRKVSDFMKPEFREAFETEYLAKLKERKKLEGVTSYFTKDGRKVYVEWKSTLVEPEVGPPFITGIARDITEKFLIQRSLKESESRLKAIFETVPVPVAVYDSNGCLIALNTAFTEVFGWTLEEAKGQKLPPLPEEEIEEVRLKREEAVRKGSIQTLKGHRFTKDGKLLDVEIYASALVAKNGKLELLVVAFHDVTERNRLEKALQHAEKMEALGTLAGGIAHNFNNILMGILGNAQLLKMRLGKEHPEAKRIDTILTLINDASNLTKQMLGLAKGGKYELRPTDLNVLIREHNRIFGQTRKDVEIREELSDGLWSVMCDRGQMKQVLMNLYVNAVQAMEAKSAQVAPGFERKVIAIKTENVFLKERQLGEYQPDEGDFVKISISDNGIGMDEHIKKRIFEPFFTTKTMGRGTGLGLASVYGIVKNHGGYIEVESTLGEGSTFHIYLPRMSQFAEIKDKQEKKEYKLARRTGTILLVDDEELVLQTAKELIEELGFKVIGVTDPLEALKVHEDYEDKLDLIIVDMIMPKMNGLELIKAIREKDQNVKIMVSSGYGLESDLIGAEELNIAGIVQKPFSIHSISDAINAVI